MQAWYQDRNSRSNTMMEASYVNCAKKSLVMVMIWSNIGELIIPKGGEGLVLQQDVEGVEEGLQRQRVHQEGEAVVEADRRVKKHYVERRGKEKKKKKLNEKQTVSDPHGHLILCGLHEEGRNSWPSIQNGILRK